MVGDGHDGYCLRLLKVDNGKGKAVKNAATGSKQVTRAL